MNRHRQALLTWAVVYPLITGLLLLLEPWLEGVTLPLRTFVLSALMVPILSYLALPILMKRLASWLASAAKGT